MADNSDSSVMDILDYHADLIRKYFGDEVTQIYIGDVINYPPIAFQNRKGEQGIIVALVVDDMVPHQVSAAGGVWDLKVSIIAIANMVPEFEAMPDEAFAERRILQFVTRYMSFLTKTENLSLHGRVSTSKVENVQFDYMQREDMALRGAAILWNAKVYLDNTW